MPQETWQRTDPVIWWSKRKGDGFLLRPFRGRTSGESMTTAARVADRVKRTDLLIEARSDHSCGSKTMCFKITGRGKPSSFIIVMNPWL